MTTSVDVDLLSVDIETTGSRITCIGFAPSESDGRSLYHSMTNEQRMEAIGRIRE